MSAQTIRDFINRHAVSQTALAVLGATLDAHATGTPLDGALAARATELLDAVGLRDACTELSAPEAAQFIAELRQTSACDASLLYADTRATSWSHSDPRLLQAVGDFSRAFARGLTRGVIPALEGLAPRFGAADGAFLDIGVGVASLSIELAGLWPQLHITGIDVSQPALARARANVDTAGLAARIALREQAAETMTDDRAFDLAWMPIVFMPERIVPAAMERTFAALRPGGWIVLGFPNIEAGDPTTRAIWRLRTTMFGGPMWTVPEVEAKLHGAGFVDVKLMPTPPGAPALLVARRPA